jgi:hypothetical protein
VKEVWIKEWRLRCLIMRPRYSVAESGWVEFGVESI